MVKTVYTNIYLCMCVYTTLDKDPKDTTECLDKQRKIQ